MFQAEQPVLERLVELLLAGRSAVHLLDVGVGAARFAELANACDLEAYVGIELNRTLAERAADRLGVRPHPIEIQHGAWQDTMPGLGVFDAVMYDTWPPKGHADADFDLFIRELNHGHMASGGRVGVLSLGNTFPRRKRECLLRHFDDVTIENIPLAYRPDLWPTDSASITIAVGL